MSLKNIINNSLYWELHRWGNQLKGISFVVCTVCWMLQMLQILCICWHTIYWRFWTLVTWLFSDDTQKISPLSDCGAGETDPAKAVRNVSAWGQRLVLNFDQEFTLSFRVQCLLTTGAHFYGMLGINPTCLHSACRCSVDVFLRL